MPRSSLLAELWAFMRVRKKWWLMPIVVVMLAVGVLIAFAQGSALAPFIYTLFYRPAGCTCSGANGAAIEYWRGRLDGV